MSKGAGDIRTTVGHFGASAKSTRAATTPLFVPAMTGGAALCIATILRVGIELLGLALKDVCEAHGRAPFARPAGVTI